MRTTLTIDDDVAQKVRQLAKDFDRPFKDIVNEALRLGLEHVEKPGAVRLYVTASRPLGLRQGFSFDNIQELLSETEGENSR